MGLKVNDRFEAEKPPAEARPPLVGETVTKPSGLVHAMRWHICWTHIALSEFKS